MRVPPRPLWASYPLDHAERAALGWKVMDQIGMTITLDLPQEVQAELASQAAAHGMGIDAYAASLLKQAVYPTARACPRRIGWRNRFANLDPSIPPRAHGLPGNNE